MENIVCRSCGHRNTGEDSVCRNCGKALDREEDGFPRCSNGHIITGGSRFCPWCGEELGAGGRGATERYQPGPDSQRFRETVKVTAGGGRQTQVISRAPAPDSKRTRVIRPGADEEGRAEDSAAGEPRLVGFLVSYTLDPNGFFFALREGRQNIGSGPEVTFRVEDPELSREHAVLLYRNGRFILEDRLSSNGSYLNGEEVIGQREIQHGDRLGMGGHVYILIGVPPDESR